MTLITMGAGCLKGAKKILGKMTNQKRCYLFSYLDSLLTIYPKLLILTPITARTAWGK
jgi:hypothetical protein